MNITSFDRLYIHELKDAYNAERQIAKALPKMADGASNSNLRQLFEEHLEETQTQIQRLEQIFDNLDFSPTGEVCQAMQGIIEEAQEILGDESIPDNVRDAALIASAQRVEHYEMSVYGTLCHYAKILGRQSDLEILSETLDEEKMADEKLNELAIKEINQRALEGTEETQRPRPSM